MSDAPAIATLFVTDEGTFVCRKCQKAKPCDQFWNKQTWCKECFRDYYWRRSSLRLYGLSVEQIQEMLDLQGGKCAACNSLSPCAHTGRWCIDHCHATGNIRGVLCDPCNRILGAAGDSVHRLAGLIKYLAAGE